MRMESPLYCVKIDDANDIENKKELIIERVRRVEHYAQRRRMTSIPGSVIPMQPSSLKKPSSLSMYMMKGYGRGGNFAHIQNYN